MFKKPDSETSQALISCHPHRVQNVVQKIQGVLPSVRHEPLHVNGTTGCTSRMSRHGHQEIPKQCLGPGDTTPFITPDPNLNDFFRSLSQFTYQLLTHKTLSPRKYLPFFKYRSKT